MSDKAAKFIEEHGPWLSALGICACAAVNDWLIPPPKDFSSLLQATINVAAIAVGFLATAKGILISADNREVVKNLKAAKQFLPLVNYFISATVWCLVLCFSSAFLLVIDLGTPMGWKKVILYIWLGVLGGAALACVRVIYLFNLILRGLAK